MLKLNMFDEEDIRLFLAMNLHFTINMMFPGQVSSAENAARFMQAAPDIATENGMTDENIDLIGIRILEVACNIKEPARLHKLDNFSEFLLEQILEVGQKWLDESERIQALADFCEPWRKVLSRYILGNELDDSGPEDIDAKTAKHIVDVTLHLNKLTRYGEYGKMIFSDENPILSFDAKEDIVPDICDDFYDLDGSFVDSKLMVFKRKPKSSGKRKGKTQKGEAHKNVKQQKNDETT